MIILSVELYVWCLFGEYRYIISINISDFVKILEGKNFQCNYKYGSLLRRYRYVISVNIPFFSKILDDNFIIVIVKNGILLENVDT